MKFAYTTNIFLNGCELNLGDCSRFTSCNQVNVTQNHIKNNKVADHAEEIINIAEKSLKNSQTGEELFLQPLKDLTFKGLSPADIIQKKWNSTWNKDLGKMIKYLNSLE